MLSFEDLASDCNYNMNQQICRFYSNGFCRYSDNCRFSHDLEVKAENTISDTTSGTNWKKRDTVQNFRRPPVRFQRFNYAFKGQSGRFEQTRNFNLQEVLGSRPDVKGYVGTSTEQLQSNTFRRSPRYFYKRLPRWRNARGNRFRRPLGTQGTDFKNFNTFSENNEGINESNEKQEVSLVDENNEKMDPLKKLRQTEIQQFQKRFPKHKTISQDIFYVEYFPTDPDWSFEVKSINLQVEFPDRYPEIPFLITVIDEDCVLPDMLIKHLNRTIRTWISERWEKNNGKAELAFRPFLRWLDKNLEELFICGLRLTKQDIETKAAGIEFVPHEMLCNAKSDQMLDEGNSSSSDDTSIKDDCESEEVIESADILLSKAKGITDENKDIINITRQLSIDDPPQINKSNISGLKTEIKFKDLYLSEHAATLTCQKLHVMIICDRCKTRHDLITLANRLNLATCTKCQQVQELTFQPSLLHQNSSIVGYVHLQHCQIIDLPLVSCEFSVSCLNCSRQCTLTGIHYNLQRITWCTYCNSKMSVAIQGVRFLQLQYGENLEKYQTHSVKLSSKFVKNQILPVQLGKPLPANGTCKHYKQSFRWLRFPCCGKVYPCDICHNEKESDHEMKLANRMICGFCAREQPYTKDKECIGCNASVTKKASTHWEGGKGCRDRTKMSKSDKHKYCGTNKTKSIKKVSGNVKSVQ